MSGVSWKPSNQTITATWDKEGKPTYQVTYHVLMDDPADGPQQVMAYLAEDAEIAIGTPYVLGNDSDPTAFCNQVTPTRRDGSDRHWSVALQYAVPDPEDEKQTPGGEPSQDPADWRWSVDMGSVAWQEPCWSAWNETAFPHPAAVARAGSYTRPVGVYGPVVNSAGVVLDPTLTRDVFDRILQIQCYSFEYDSAISDLYQGSINLDVLQYSELLTEVYKVKPISGGIAKHTVKCTRATASFRTTKVGDLVIPFWQWNWEFRFRAATWLEEVLDRGLTQRADSGMGDGMGGTYPSVEDAAAAAGPVVDPLGRRVPELVLFDGAGWPVEPSTSAEIAGTYFAWRKDPNYAMAAIPFPFFRAGS